MPPRIEVIIKRGWADARATLGMLQVKGETHDPIFTLENPERDAKADSRIPAGFYTCIPYSGQKYKDVYLVQNVPGRTAILFHWGNFEKDTLGCILLGDGAGMLDGKPAVVNSLAAFQRFRYLIGDRPFDLTIV